MEESKNILHDIIDVLLQHQMEIMTYHRLSDTRPWFVEHNLPR